MTTADEKCREPRRVWRISARHQARNVVITRGRDTYRRDPRTIHESKELLREPLEALVRRCFHEDRRNFERGQRRLWAIGVHWAHVLYGDPFDAPDLSDESLHGDICG